MSNIYIQEPPTNGKVLLSTTVGDLEIELWSKEAPLACRNFVQLCLEGFYDKTIFHRLVPNFVVQGGDPSGTGFGGESIYGEPFRDEFHTRLRFVRRGLLAAANNGEKDSNGSQFFFTLGATPDLEKKHTIFGKVVGDTIYNLLKLNEREVDANERPVFVDKILKTEVLNNPFADIVPRRKKTEDDFSTQKSFSKSKATKNFGLLSFGDEAEEEEEQTAAVSSTFRAKGKSSHDLAKDPVLSSQSVLSVPSEESTKSSNSSSELQRVQEKLRSAEIIHDERPANLPAIDEAKNSKVELLRKEAELLAKELTAPRLIKEADNKVDDVKKANLAVADYHCDLDAYESRRRKKGEDRESQVLAKLKKFTEKMRQVRHEEDDLSAEPAANLDDHVGLDWMKTTLSFEEEQTRLAKDANLKSADWYDIYDPRNPINKRRRETDSSKNKKPKSTNLE